MKRILKSPPNFAFKLLNATHQATVSTRRVRQLAKHFADVIPPRKRVLDIGTGNGRLARRILDLRPDLTIQGIDVRSNIDAEIPVTEYDGITIPFEGDSWDICMASDVLHHCDDPMAMLREMNRVAIDAIVIKDHFADTRFDYTLLCAMDWAGNFGYGTQVPFNFLSSREWLESFSTIGLTPVEVRKSLQLYPIPFTWLLDRNLHFVALLSVRM